MKVLKSIEMKIIHLQRMLSHLTNLQGCKITLFPNPNFEFFNCEMLPKFSSGSVFVMKSSVSKLAFIFGCLYRFDFDIKPTLLYCVLLCGLKNQAVHDLSGVYDITLLVYICRCYDQGYVAIMIKKV